jgi:hypothetical protein
MKESIEIAAEMVLRTLHFNSRESFMLSFGHRGKL